MALIRKCLDCEAGPVVPGRDLCADCAQAFDDQMAGMLEQAASGE